MSLAFGVAGVLQAYLERVQGQPYMLAQPDPPLDGHRPLHGLLVVAGVGLTVYQLLTMKPAAGGPGAAADVAVAAGA